MSGALNLSGLGPLQTVRMLPDAEAFVVGMPDGGWISCVLTAAAPLPSLPLPIVVAAPVITGNARVGQTPVVTAATWVAIPATPPGMTREIETRFTIAGVAVTTPLASGTQAQQVRAEARARHVLGAQQGAWSAWFQSDAVTVSPESTNPVLEPLSFNPSTQRLTAPFSYDGGADTLIAIVALRSGGSANTAANMVANTGTWIERGVVDPFSIDEFDLTGLFTAAANGATAVDVVIAEKNNGGVSAVQFTAVSGLNLDPSSATLALTGGRTDGILITFTGTLTITGGRTDGLRIEAV